MQVVLREWDFLWIFMLQALVEELFVSQDIPSKAS